MQDDRAVRPLGCKPADAAPVVGGDRREPLEPGRGQPCQRPAPPIADGYDAAGPLHGVGVGGDVQEPVVVLPLATYLSALGNVSPRLPYFYPRSSEVSHVGKAVGSSC